MATKKARLKNSSGDYIIPYVPVDSELSSTSENPIQNKVVNTALSGYQTKTNLVTSVSSSSTDSQYPSAKLFYDTCGDIGALINAL